MNNPSIFNTHSSYVMDSPCATSVRRVLILNKDEMIEGMDGTAHVVIAVVVVVVVVVDVEVVVAGKPTMVDSHMQMKRA